MRRLGTRLAREDGQISVLFLLGVVTLVMLVMMLLNTGQHVTERIEVQNSADSLALSRANWAARSLNMVAMNQVAMTQATAVATATTALLPVAVQAIPDAIKGAKNAYTFLGGCSAASAACLVAAPACLLACQTYGWAAVAAFAAAGVDAAAVTGALKGGALGVEYANYAGAFVAMNDHIAETFPSFSAEITDRLAEENLVESPVFYPAQESDSGSPSTPLPVTKIPLIPDLSLDSGYDIGAFCYVLQKGDLIRPIPTNYQGLGYDAGVGPTDAAWADVENHIFGPLGFYVWMQPFSIPFMPKKKWIPLKLPEKGDLGGDVTPENEWNPETDPNNPDATDPGDSAASQEGKNEFAKLMKIAVAAVCATRTAPGIPPRPLTLYRVNQRPYVPLTRPQKTRDALSFLAFARRAKLDGQAKLQGEYFKVATPSTYAYAQAEVYNTTTFIPNPYGETPANYDLFSQGWRARLTPAKLLQQEKDGQLDFADATISDALGADTEYKALVEWFDALSLDDLEQINVH